MHKDKTNIDISIELSNLISTLQLRPITMLEASILEAMKKLIGAYQLTQE
jgi:hypothetical protein